MSIVLEARGLTKSFGAVTALSAVSLSAGAGSITGLIGPDGAGKSTVLRILATVLSPDAGTATLLGHDLKTGRDELRRLIGYMPQRFSLYDDLSVAENIRFFADIFGLGKKDREARTVELLAFSRLERFTGRRARALSGGMKQKLALACALVHRPSFLILDEPTVGVDPVSRQDFWDILRRLRSEGMPIVVSTAYMDEAAWCDELFLLHEGRVLSQGSPAAVSAALPGRYFEIGSAGSVPRIAADVPLPAGLDLLYPAAGALRCMTRSETLDHDSVLRLVKELIPAASSIRPVTPDIRDVFFSLLSKNAQGGNGA